MRGGKQRYCCCISSLVATAPRGGADETKDSRELPLLCKDTGKRNRQKETKSNGSCSRPTWTRLCLILSAFRLFSDPRSFPTYTYVQAFREK